MGGAVAPVQTMCRVLGVSESGCHAWRARRRLVAPEAPLPPELVQRTFRATAPNQLWVADIMYILTAAGSHYPAVALDLYIDSGCNPHRRHSALGHGAPRSPARAPSGAHAHPAYARRRRRTANKPINPTAINA